MPCIKAAEISSHYDIEEMQVFDDVAVVSRHFYGTMKMRDSGEIRNPKGRLVLVYKRGNIGTNIRK